MKKMISRRNFMKVCAIAGSATATTACNASAAGQFGVFDWLRRKPSVSADTTDFSKYQAEAPGEGAASVSNIVSLANVPLLTLNNGVQMPQLGLGTQIQSLERGDLGVLNRTSREASATALDLDYRHLDDAHGYLNERGVGQGIVDSGVPREEIWLTSKFWPSDFENVYHALDEMLNRLGVEYLDLVYADAVDKTLARLDTDYIDLLLIHQPAGDYVAGYRLMEKAYKEGKVRAIGLSNFNEEQIKEILSICEVKPTILQTEVHPYAQQKELKAFLAENGMVIQAWYPLGHADKGLLEEPLFTRLAAKYGKSNVQIILRWHIQAGNVVIPGSKNPAHIHDNFDVFDFALTDAEMQEITTLNKDKRYYEVTEDKLAAFATMFPPVEDQK